MGAGIPVVCEWGGYGSGIFCDLSAFMPYEYTAVLTGILGIFVYIYLFSSIPMAQRIFTYFMVVTSMNLVVLFARTVSVFAAPYIPVSYGALFLIVYVPVLIGFEILFYFKLYENILKGLKAFKGHLNILAIFASMGYVTLVLLVDIWEVWEPLDIRGMIQWMALIVFVISGYVVAFRTLVSIHNQMLAEVDARNLSEQLVLSEQYYETLVKQVEQARAYNHDLKYHIETLGGLCADKDWSGIKAYVEEMNGTLPESLSRQYCAVGAVNALLEYYCGLCREKGIDFRCQVHIPKEMQIRPLHLCVVLGNALRNALEAACQLADDMERYIVLRVAPASEKLAISVENPCLAEPESDENGGLRTTKKEPGHGLGLGSICEVARHYNGWCGTKWENGIFTLQVMLTEKK